MVVVLWIFGAMFIWIIVGCGVLAAIDDEDQRLFKWATSAPFKHPLYELTVMLWPYILWLWWKGKKEGNE